MRAFAFLVALLSLAMAEAFLAPAALKAPRVVSDDRETTDRQEEEAERDVVVVRVGLCGCVVAMRGNDVLCHSSAAAAMREGDQVLRESLIHTEITPPRC